MTQAQTLQSELHALGQNAEVTELRSGHLHVRIGRYNLTITHDGEISAANIVKGALHMNA